MGMRGTCELTSPRVSWQIDTESAGHHVEQWLGVTLFKHRLFRLQIIYARLNADSANISKARLCTYSVFRSFPRSTGVKCLFTPKTPCGLIPRMQTLTRGECKACLHVFEEIIADFLCFRGLGLLIRNHVNQTVCGSVRRTSAFDKYSRFEDSVAYRIRVRGLPRTDVHTRKSVLG